MNKINNKKTEPRYYLIVFIIPVVCMIIHMIIKKCYPFGSNTILIGDADSQYYVFMESLLNKIKSGESLFYSWDYGMGFDYYSNFFYYLASPFNIIALFIGLWDMKLGVVIVMLVQSAMCGVTMLYYLNNSDRFEIDQNNCCKEMLRVVLALAYSMSGYILTYQYNYIWLISLLMAPIVMLGVERLVEGKSRRLYLFSLITVFITNYYFAWFICILALVWFIDQDKKNFRNGIRKFGQFCFTSIVGALVSSVVLVPCYIAVSGRNIQWGGISPDTVGLFGNIGNFLQSLFWDHYIDKSTKVVQFYPELGYCGIFTVILCVLFCINKNIRKKIRYKRILEILVMAVSLNFYWAVYLLHGFTIPHLLFGRFEFIFVILLIVTAYDMLCNFEKINMQQIIILIVVLSMAVLVAILFNNNTQNLFCYLGTILIAAYICICFLLYSIESINRKSVYVNLIVVAMLEIVSNFFMANTNSYRVGTDTITSYEKWNDMYNDIELNSGERKNAYIQSQSYMGYSNTDLFASSINTDFLFFMGKIGLTYQDNGSSYVYRGTTPLTAAMFNVRYVLSDRSLYWGGYKEVGSKTVYNDIKKEDQQCILYENEALLGIGWWLPESIKDVNIDDKNPFEVQNSIAQKIENKNIFTPAIWKSASITFDGCNIYDMDGFKCSYQNIQNDKKTKPWVEYACISGEEMDLYVYVYDINSVTCEVWVDDELLNDKSDYTSPGEMLHIGKVKSGQSIRIKVTNYSSYTELGENNIVFYALDQQSMNDCLAKMRLKENSVKQMRGRKFECDVYMDKDGILCLAIPYSKGFTVYIDGKKTDMMAICGGLCGVELGKGKHTVRLLYTPYGFWLGLLMSVIGIAGEFGYYFLANRSGIKDVIKERNSNADICNSGYQNDSIENYKD